MRTLIVYYSLTENCKFIAETMAGEIQADTLRLQPQESEEKYRNEGKKPGLIKIFWLGREVMTKKKPELLPLGKNPADYDLIIIGTPVWVGTFAPPLRTFFDTIKLQGKKIGLFCCYGGQPSKTFTEMKSLLPGNEILGEISFKEPLKGKAAQSEEKAKEWVRKIVN